jgi:transposase
MKNKKEVVDRIIETLERGDGRVAACENAGVSYQTFLRWIDEKSEFCELIKKAEENGLDRIKDVQIQKILSNDSWQSAAWWLERNYPERFGKRDSHDLTSKGESIQLPTIVFKRQTKEDE